MPFRQTNEYVEVAAPDPHKWMTATEAAKILHTTRAAVSYSVKAGKLRSLLYQPPKQHVTRYVYRTDVTRLKSERTNGRAPKIVIDKEARAGEIAGRAFAMLDRGEDFIALVRDLEITPEHAADLCAAYQKGLAYVAEKKAARERDAKNMKQLEHVATVLKR